MLGRLGAGVLADLGGWRLALAAVGALGLACAVVCVRILPPSRHFVARGLSRRGLAASLSDRALRRLYLMGALLMGTFVAVYNGLGFRLEAQPYGLGPGAIAAVFLVYPIGVVSSAVAGRLADWIGRRRVLPAGVLVAAAGLAVTAFRPLPVVIAGMAVLTAGFFAAHSVASSWVGRRGGTVSAQAPALYLLAYYAGSSVAGTLAGSAWSLEQWTGVLVLGGSLLAIALAVSLRLRRTPPLGAVRPAPLAA
jgi:MFS transporter, YNFM family, putative membrane transport protein